MERMISVGEEEARSAGKKGRGCTVYPLDENKKREDDALVPPSLSSRNDTKKKKKRKRRRRRKKKLVVRRTVLGLQAVLRDARCNRMQPVASFTMFL